MPGIKQLSFLNPASTLTPGIAGGLTTTIALAVATQFGVKFNWVALFVSLLLGAMVALAYPQKIAPILRSLFVVLNALVIFSFSVGAGRTFDTSSPPAAPVPPPAVGVPHLAGQSEQMDRFVADKSIGSMSPSQAESTGELMVESRHADGVLRVKTGVTSPGPTGTDTTPSISTVTNDPKVAAALLEELRRTQDEKDAALEKVRREQELREAEAKAFTKQQSQLKEYQQKLDQYDKARAQYDNRWSW